MPFSTLTFCMKFGPCKNTTVLDIDIFDVIRRLQKQSPFGHTQFGCESGPAETIPCLTLSFWLRVVTCKNNPLFDMRIFHRFRGFRKQSTFDIVILEGFACQNKTIEQSYKTANFQLDQSGFQHLLFCSFSISAKTMPFSTFTL